MKIIITRHPRKYPTHATHASTNSTPFLRLLGFQRTLVILISFVIYIRTNVIKATKC